MAVKEFVSSICDLLNKIPDKWIAVFLFIVTLAYHHFHPDEFIKGLVNNFQGALLTALTMGFRHQESAIAKRGDTLIATNKEVQSE